MFMTNARSFALVMIAALTALGSQPTLAQQAPGLAVPLPPASIGTQSTGPTPQFAQAAPASIAEANIRIERLEGELRQLTGHMEQLMFQMRQLQDELTRSREDTEFRLRELEGGGVAPTDSSATAMPQGGVDVSDDTLRQALLAREQNQAQPAVQGTPPQDLGTLNVDANGVPIGGTVAAPVTGPNGPLDLSSLTLNGDPSARPQTPLGNQIASTDPLASLSSDDLYQLGYDQVLRGDYRQSVLTFEDFLNQFGDDPLRPNAHFWLGESHFALGDYTPAAEQFLTVFNSYPEDVKVPDALLKLAMSLQRLGAQEQACATFDKLIGDYPRAPQIVLDTARTEQGLAGC